MRIRHHVGDDLLLAYGAGTLDEAMSLMVATHLALCPLCRAGLDLAEAIGSALIDSAPAGSGVDETMLEALMEGAERDDDAGTADRPTPVGPCVLPQPLRSYAGGDAPGLGWRAVGGGIRQFPLKTDPTGATARLLSIPAGKGVPEHGHRGFEATLVLAGSFYDRGSWYRRGDVAVADPSVMHRPVAGPEEDCICLAVADARLRFRAPIPRLLQPFHGI